MILIDCYLLLMLLLLYCDDDVIGVMRGPRVPGV